MDNANSVGMPLDPNIKLELAEESKSAENGAYASLIGSLMYAAIATRPDIAYMVSQLASFTANPNLGHWTAAKRVLRYLAGTWDLGIVYSANDNPERPTKNFYSYSDTDFANNLDCLSISGYAFLLSNGAIMWSSKKQNAVTLSTAEAEYTAMAHMTKEAIWLRNLFTELGFHQTELIIIFG